MKLEPKSRLPAEHKSIPRKGEPRWQNINDVEHKTLNTGPNCRRTLKSNGANGVFAEASVEGEALNESIASIGRPAQANE